MDRNSEFHSGIYALCFIAPDISDNYKKVFWEISKSIYTEKMMITDRILIVFDSKLHLLSHKEKLRNE